MKEDQKRTEEDESFTRTNFKEMVTGLGQLFTKILGTEVKPTFLKEKDYQEFKNIIEEARKLSEQKEKLDKSTLPMNFKLKQGMRIMDKFLQTFGMGTMKEFASNVVKVWNPEIGYGRYIPNVAYIKQKRESLHKIIFTLEKNGSLGKIDEFNNSIGDSIFEISQMGFRLEEKLPYILKERIRASKTTIGKFLEIYKNVVSAYVESMIVYLYGIQKISKGSLESYSVLRKGRISEQTKELKKDPLFRTFVEKYDNNIRNSIIHGGYHIDPTTKKIHFSYKKLKPLGYYEFVNYVQEIVRNAIFIINLKNEINFLTLQASQKKLDSIDAN